MRPGRTFTALLPCLVLGATAAAAQVPDSQPTPAVTPEAESRDTAARPPAQPAGPQALEERAHAGRTSYFPYLTGGANDSPVLAFRVRHWQPAEYEARTTYTAAFNADAGHRAQGQPLRLRPFPRHRGCGMAGDSAWPARAERQVRYGYFGLGNDTRHDKNAVDRSRSVPLPLRRTRDRARRR